MNSEILRDVWRPSRADEVEIGADKLGGPNSYYHLLQQLREFGCAFLESGDAATSAEPVREMSRAWYTRMGRPWIRS